MIKIRGKIIKRLFTYKSLLIIFAMALIYLSYINMKDQTAEEKKFLAVKMANVDLSAELADTPEKRMRGLSGREKLGENEGMLFMFDEEAMRNFWMKDMNFPLDIIWLDENKKIVDITKNASRDSYPERFSPASPAKYVLEVNAEFADKHKIKIGEGTYF